MYMYRADLTPQGPKQVEYGGLHTVYTTYMYRAGFKDEAVLCFGSVKNNFFNLKSWLHLALDRPFVYSSLFSYVCISGLIKIS